MATVNIMIESVIDNPVAQGDEFNTLEGQIVEGNVLNDNGNGVDFDADGDLLSVTAGSITTVEGGIVELLADGSFSYTSADGFFGTDSFDYTLVDDAGGTDAGTVFVIVDELAFHAPVAENDFVTGLENQSVMGNILANNGNGVDSDPEGDDIHTFAEIITTIQGGTVIISDTGDFTYTPVDGFLGVDSFNYILIDSAGGADIGTVVITMPTNRAPDAEDDEFTTNEDAVLNGNVLANDSDPDGDSLIVTAATFITAAGGMVELLETGDFTYTPALNFFGNDSFEYTALDTSGVADIATVNITIDSVNDAPTATDDNFTTAEDTPLTGNVLVDNGNGADNDVEDETILSVVAQTVTTAAGGSIVFYNQEILHIAVWRISMA